jgi:hypothetical protein
MIHRKTGGESVNLCLRLARVWEPFGEATVGFTLSWDYSGITTLRGYTESSSTALRPTHLELSPRGCAGLEGARGADDRIYAIGGLTLKSSGEWGVLTAVEAYTP